MYAPSPGLTINPLLSIPRNLPCPCDSGRKYKKCHLPTMPYYISQSLAATYQKAMNMPHLIQFTNDPAPEDKPKCLIER